jgi:hypothetical protein
MATDLEIARAAQLRPIREIAEKAGIPESALEPYGRHKAKIGLDFVTEQESRPDGALVLVTGISPTPAGEGKTTTTVGLGDALNSLGTRTMIALREPSLGPCFWVACRTVFHARMASTSLSPRKSWRCSACRAIWWICSGGWGASLSGTRGMGAPSRRMT